MQAHMAEYKRWNTVYSWKMLPHNGGFCNGCITKRTLLLQAFHAYENQYYADYDKKYYNFIYLFFYHREIVILDHFVPLFLSYRNTVMQLLQYLLKRFLGKQVITVNVHYWPLQKQFAALCIFWLVSAWTTGWFDPSLLWNLQPPIEPLVLHLWTSWPLPVMGDRPAVASKLRLVQMAH